MVALILSGVLVMLSSGNELARESWRDDGKVLKSAVTLFGKRAQFSVDHATRALTIEEGDQVTKVPVPAGAAPLPNGLFAVYGLYATWYKEALTPQSFTAVLGPGVSYPATVQVVPGPSGGKQVTIHIGPTVIEATVDAKGAVTHAAVPSQGVEVKPVSAATPPIQAPRPAPAGAHEETFTLERGGAKLAGVLWRPNHRAPVVVVIAGSGPVDRDGNAKPNLDTDSYRQLATALLGHGVATLRYDKRGVGGSTLGKPADQLSFADYVDDAAALVDKARHDPRLGKVFLFGHSEGALIALSVAGRVPVDGVVTAAGPGRPLGTVMREQLESKISPAALAEYDQLVQALRDGGPMHPTSPALRQIFAPQNRTFLRELLAVDPITLARAYRGPLTVLQGDNDLQVRVDKDAKPLAAAHPGARLVVLHDVSHLLKVDRVKTAAQSSYHDPKLPLAQGVVEAVLAQVH